MTRAQIGYMFSIIFDNAGGITFQTPAFCHHYDNPEQVARDVQDFLNDGTTQGWEGNEPECRQEYNPQIEASGGYRWHDQQTVFDLLNAGRLKVNAAFGWNMVEFYRTLGVKIDD